MTGELIALLAAVAYGFAGVAIVRGKATACGDNGVFLSALTTAGLTGGLWALWGRIPAADLIGADNLKPLAIFALAGLASTVLGRLTMYRATERIGPVASGLLRRATPVFALPLAYVLLDEIPGPGAIAGAILVIVAAFTYLSPARVPGTADAGHGRSAKPGAGVQLGIASAGFYGASYALRSYGLDLLPDALLGTCIGALTGIFGFIVIATLSKFPGAGLRRLIADRGPWHWLTALALSAGQTLQFFALKSAPVVTVATLGSLEVFFSALLGAIMIGRLQVSVTRLAVAVSVATAGTALLVW